ncbi:response regulator [Paraburkholderia pallida]|uniref:histidine kinase n=1 Tax=Paraburkholderia pallida TaxID=2547399 RepID=A0A4P7D3G3_9BURK|nr:response regulator [Paraburkholderia pallida]QBR01064.1 response regulator [Paraburkholderia pallida]
MVMPRESMTDMLERSRLAIRWGGILGLLCHPIYYVVWTWVLPQPYDNLFLRLSAACLCIPLIFQAHWPKQYSRYLLIYWHVCLIYVLPFVCTFLAIRNGFSTMWMMTEVMMIFILALCIDSPLLLMACIGAGIAASIVAAVITFPTPIILSAADMSNIALLPVVVLCSMVFSHAISKGRIIVEKNRALKALAGSIAHEMRNPLSQLRYVLDGMEEALPASTEIGRSLVLTHANATSLYRYLAQGQLSIERGLQIIAMTLDEVSAKPIRSDHLAYLRAASTTRKVLDEYGFADDTEHSKVRLLVLEDFVFKVDETVYLFTLFNLIKNALHHMAAHPSATLTLVVDRHTVVVRDTGPGISPEILPHLFEPLRTAGNSAGTGLGLAYCQRAMQAFGGTITCHSQLGEFTQFTLRFPAIADREIAEHEREILARATPVFHGKSILLVDDDVDQRLKVQRVLSKLGAQISEADNGQRALAMLQGRGAAPCDLVLMDVNMPVMDGYTTTERIRAGSELPNRDVLIAGYTAESGNVAHVLARRAGMDDVISKSCGMMELITSLQALFESGDRRHLGKGFEGFQGKSILVADDDTFSRLVAKAYLERCGASVIEAEHGDAVLSRLKDGTAIDAVVIDMNMPGMGGVEATSLIRARNDRYARIPIIALTAQTDMDAVRECMAAGMNEVVTKPVQVGALYAALARQFARQRVLHTLTKADSSPDSLIPPHAEPIATDGELLDKEQLDELARLDLLDETFLNGITQIRSLLTQLSAAAEKQDIEAAHAALHRLLGVSGNMGAQALHALVRNVYPRLVAGQWPLEPDWIGRITALGERSADALQTYCASAKTTRGYDKVPRDE